MNKLLCYGITKRALQLLLGEESSEIPSAWFNFNTHMDAGRCKRLTLLDPECQTENVLNWNKASKSDGYDCVLVYSTEDPSHLTDHAVGLSDDVVLHPIYHKTTGSIKDEYKDVLNLLREPEDFFVNGWALVTGGGGVSIDYFGLAKVTMSQWWAYGLGLKKWINCTANGKPDSKHRQNCPDYAPWNYIKARGLDKNYPDTKLDIDMYWNASSSATLGWSINNACKPTDIPEMSNDGFIAYYPMRQMPCCGVAVTESGELKPFGALSDEKDINGNWVWAAENTKAAFRTITRKVIEQNIHAGTASTKGSTKIQSNVGVIIKAVTTTGAANAGQFRMYATSTPLPIPKLNVKWQQNFGDHSVICKLHTEGTKVFFECDTILSTEKPSVTKLRSLWKVNEEWGLEPNDDRWQVSRLTWTDFNSRLKTLFPNGPNDDNLYLLRGYFVC